MEWDWLLFISTLLSFFAALFILYSNMGTFYDRETGRLYALGKEKPQDKITGWEMFWKTLKKNRAAFLGFIFLMLAFFSAIDISHFKPGD